MQKFILFLSKFILLIVSLFIYLGCSKSSIKEVAVSSVTLNTTSLSLEEGYSATITATVSPQNANNKKVIWTSSNSSVAIVDNGIITAIKAGEAVITAISDDGGKTATCIVTVLPKRIPVDNISLNANEIVIKEGESETLVITIVPDNATNKAVIWKSSDSAIATVNNGIVTAIKAGNTTITVTTEDGGKTSSCGVKVTPKVDPIPLGTIKNVSLDSKPSHQEILLPRDIEKEGATVKAQDDASWIRHLSINGDKLSFDVEENPFVTTGHRFDTLVIRVTDIIIGKICVSQARSRKGAEKLAWCTTNASYYSENTPKLSGKELTILIYNLEKTTNGADSYKNYPAFAYCIEMNHDPDNDMEWHLPSSSDLPPIRTDNRFTEGYFWTTDSRSVVGKTAATVFKSFEAQVLNKKTELNYVYAFRNGSAD